MDSTYVFIFDLISWVCPSPTSVINLTGSFIERANDTWFCILLLYGSKILSFQLAMMECPSCCC